MTSAELDNLVRIGKLKVEPPHARELKGLLDSARARLADAANVGLAFDSRFDLASGGLAGCGETASGDYRDLA